MPKDKDPTAVSSCTHARQQPSNIAPTPQLDDVFPKVILQTINIDATDFPTPPLVEALLDATFTTWFDFVFSCDDDQFSQLTIGSGRDKIPLYKNHVDQLLLLWGMVDKFVFDDNIKHLASAPYTRDAYMDFSLLSAGPNSSNNLPRVQHLLLPVSPPSRVLSLWLSKVRLKRITTVGTVVTVPRMMFRSFIPTKAILSGYQNSVPNLNTKAFLISLMMITALPFSCLTLI